MLEVIIKETHTRSQRTCILVFLKKLQQTHSLQCMLYGSEQSHIPWGKKKKKLTWYLLQRLDIRPRRNYGSGTYFLIPRATQQTFSMRIKPLWSIQFNWKLICLKLGMAVTLYNTELLTSHGKYQLNLKKVRQTEKIV